MPPHGQPPRHVPRVLAPSSRRTSILAKRASSRLYYPFFQKSTVNPTLVYPTNCGGDINILRDSTVVVDCNLHGMGKQGGCLRRDYGNDDDSLENRYKMQLRVALNIFIPRC
jgi:hypothetical protein